MTHELSPFERTLLHFLTPLQGDYPEFREWFIQKVVPGKRTGERRVFVRFSDNVMVAGGIAKKTPEEQKICTLYVRPDYRRQGLGSAMVQSMLEWLETDTPVISIQRGALGFFESIIARHDWILTSVQCQAEQPRRDIHTYNETRLIRQFYSPSS